MTEPSMPPPVRRIVVDRPPRVLDGDPHPLLDGGRGRALGAVGELSEQLHADAGAPAVRERMTIESVWLAYGDRWVVRDVTLPVREGEVLALIGASGSGKTTLLRSLNRLTEVTAGASRAGRITLDGVEIGSIEATALRRHISMVFQQPNPFPMSIFDNVAYALIEQRRGRLKLGRLGSERDLPGAEHDRPGAEHDRAGAELDRSGSGAEGGSRRLSGVRGLRRRGRRDEGKVITALQRAGLYEEVSGDLDRSAFSLSGGQQQRLCIARSLAADPEVLLLDEPCSALDPISTAKIEELIVTLRRSVAVVIVTHNMQQARRVADHVAFMHLGELVEYGTCEQIFERPSHPRTREYVGGAFG